MQATGARASKTTNTIRRSALILAMTAIMLYQRTQGVNQVVWG